MECRSITQKNEGGPVVLTGRLGGLYRRSKTTLKNKCFFSGQKLAQFKKPPYVCITIGIQSPDKAPKAYPISTNYLLNIFTSFRF
jgi:hypothetical protein